MTVLFYMSRVSIKRKNIGVADVWKPTQSQHIEAFQQELERVQTMVAQPHAGIKRKKDCFDNTLQGLLANKKIHLTFGTPASASAATVP